MTQEYREDERRSDSVGTRVGWADGLRQTIFQTFRSLANTVLDSQSNASPQPGAVARRGSVAEFFPKDTPPRHCIDGVVEQGKNGATP